jgi:hypothetical protein
VAIDRVMARVLVVAGARAVVKAVVAARAVAVAGAGARARARAVALVGKSNLNSMEFRNLSNSGPFELRNFHWNFIHPIVKCVLANFEHISSGFESSFAISSSDFMNRKTSPRFLIFPAKKISSCMSQPVDPTMLICVDVCTILGKAILLTIVSHLLNLGRRDFCGQNNHASKIKSTHIEYSRC